MSTDTTIRIKTLTTGTRNKKIHHTGLLAIRSSRTTL